MLKSCETCGGAFSVDFAAGGSARRHCGPECQPAAPRLDAVAAPATRLPLAPAAGHYRIDRAERGRRPVARYVGRSRRGNPGHEARRAADIDDAQRWLDVTFHMHREAYRLPTLAERRRALLVVADRIALVSRLLDDLVLDLGGEPSDCDDVPPAPPNRPPPAGRCTVVGMAATMTIAAVARRYGVSHTRVRQLDPVLHPERSSSGIRLYDERQVRFVELVRAGAPPDERKET